MAYSYVEYTGNGATRQFNVPFPYIRKEHVFVEVNNAPTSYTWVNNSTVQVSTAPANGVKVVVKRVTPVSSRLVDYTDGSTLVAADLDTDSLQHLYTEQELTDSVGPLASLRSLYYGANNADPTVDPFGQALDEGDLYFNTTVDKLRVYNGTSWQDSTNNVSYLRWKKTAAGGETSLSGADDNSQTLTYTAGLEQVYLNGALLTRGADYTATNGSSITGLAALTTGDVVEVIGLSRLAINSSSGGIDFLQAGTGAVTRTVESKLRDVVSVKDFGATGNGATDDTAAIQAALNSGAKNVTLPVGTYLSGLVSLPSGVSFIGEGGVLKAKSGTFYQVVIPQNSSNSTIANITFDATNLVPGSSVAPYPTGEASCISNGSPTVGTIKGLRILDCTFLNIPVNHPTNPQRVHSVILGYGEATVSGCYTEQCGGDIYNFNNGQFIVTNCVAKNSGDGGIAFNNGARGTIADNYIFKCDLGIGSGHQGTTASPDNSYVISGNEIVACGDGINMGWFGYVGQTAPRHVKISSNTIRRCKRVGIRYDGQPDPNWEAFIIIDGNSIYDTGATDFDGGSGDGHALTAGYCNGALVTGNAFFNNKGNDIILYGLANVVENNIIDGGSYSGTAVAGLIHEGDDQIVTGNVFDGKHFLLQSSTGSLVTGNTFKNVPGSGANQGGLIITATTSNSTITSNYFTDCGNGIFFPNSAAWNANDVLSDNRFNNCTNKALNSPLNSGYGSLYEESSYTGTCDGSGRFEFTHGTSDNGKYAAIAQAFYKGNTGESLPMVLEYIDGTVARFSGGISGRTCRAYIRYNKDFGAW